MEKMKTEFELVDEMESTVGNIEIITADDIAFVRVNTKASDDTTVAFMRIEDMERFAVNILKALKSKKLK